VCPEGSVPGLPGSVGPDVCSGAKLGPNARRPEPPARVEASSFLNLDPANCADFPLRHCVSGNFRKVVRRVWRTLRSCGLPRDSGDTSGTRRSRWRPDCGLWGCQAVVNANRVIRSFWLQLPGTNPVLPTNHLVSQSPLDAQPASAPGRVAVLRTAARTTRCPSGFPRPLRVRVRSRVAPLPVGFVEPEMVPDHRRKTGDFP
jgi:hypothetical protein